MKIREGGMRMKKRGRRATVSQLPSFENRKRESKDRAGEISGTNDQVFLVVASTFSGASLKGIEVESQGGRRGRKA